MHVEYAVNANCKLSVEAKDIKQSFAFLAYAQDVFGHKRCGNCESPNLKLCHRTPQGYEYFSVKCEDCGHELKFGQQKEGGKLFPKGWEPPFQGDDNGKKRQPQRQQEDSYDSGYEQDEPAGVGANDSIPW